MTAAHFNEHSPRVKCTRCGVWPDHEYGLCSCRGGEYADSVCVCGTNPSTKPKPKAKAKAKSHVVEAVSDLDIEPLPGTVDAEG